MSDDEDDYLSDKFLVESAAAASKPKTYAEIRKQAQKESLLKNEINRQKSRRELELEAREEGLSKSLFERAKEEQETLGGSGNKAMAMMMKMGFKPGESLGKPANEPPEPSVATPTATSSQSGHKTEPLPLNEWEGRKGIGNRKRALSPTSAERIAKMAKMAESSSQATFRDRAKQDYAERRAEGQLVSAQRTCVSLDEKHGKGFNVLWLNPTIPDSFPRGLMDALEIPVAPPFTRDNATVGTRLRQQMRSDALRPLAESDATYLASADPKYAPDVLEEATQYLRLQAQDRLELVLSYLRDRYTYCFWCGTQYENEDDMESDCPGVKEDDH